MWQDREPICLPADHRPLLLVVVDTEEEFDWSAAFTREAVSVQAMRHIHRVQEIFDAYGITPTYVCDYPIVTQPIGYEPLRELQSNGRALIGTHLHAWVTPPYEEEVKARNSYACNLPADLERAKLEQLTAAIEENCGQRPTIYKAGRYGADAETMDLLEQLGYEVDLSGCPAFDYRGDGGPNFVGTRPEPSWVGPSGRILEVPLSGAFVGKAGAMGQDLYRLASAPAFEKLRVRGILSRLGIVDRLMLSPEGYTSEEHRRLTNYLLGKGVRILSWTFHSPSVMPGCTPYVRSRRELDSFLDSFCRYFDYFFGDLDGEATTPFALKQQLETKQ
jgi:hypothetical protein